ncbi:hypothetical protein ONZ45_g15290 [Pleurotus djamor]|nr:hypothetical protein ONZ45_g15290 [Pleurotus djamor]
MPQLLGFGLSTQRAIDEEIAKHEAAIVQLRRRRNTLSVMGQLPDDILSYIFVVYKEQRIFKANPERYLNIFGVCSQWQRVIYNTPRLWAIFAPSYHFGCLQLSKMVQMSMQAPLRVCFPINDLVGVDNGLTCVEDEDYVLDLLKRLLPHGPRIEELYLTHRIYHRDFLDSFFEMLDEINVASLRILRLESVFTKARLEDVPCLSSTLLSSKAISSIQTLDLIDVLIPTDIPSLPSLVNLFVHCSALGGLSLSWLIEFTAHTPNIESIWLGDKITDVMEPAWNIFEAVPSATDDTATLPKLRRVILESDESMIAFERRIEKGSRQSSGSFSGRLTIKKPGITTHDAVLGVKSLCTLLSSTFQWSLAKQVTMIVRHDHYRLSVSQSTRVAEGLILELRLPFALRMREYIDICSSILPKTQITELTIDDPGDVKATSLLSWSRICQIFERLKILNIINGKPNFAPVILGKSLKSGPSNTLHNAALEVLSITGVNWLIASDGERYVTELRNILQKRQQMNGSLHALRISGA